VFDAYRKVLAEELGVEPSADLRARHDALLRGDAGTRAESAGSAPPARRLPLPRPSSTFVGRDALLTSLETRLERARLVTLVGPGGVGKTRLAMEAMHRLAPSFDEDVHFCDLTTANPVPVVEVVVAALAIEERAGQDEVSRLAEVLRHRRCLLVFDNCEH